MGHNNPKLEYLRSKRLELKGQMKKVQAEIDATIDVVAKDANEKRLELLFDEIEKIDARIESLERELQDRSLQREIEHLIEILRSSSDSQWDTFQQCYYTTLSHWINRVQQNVENAQAMVFELNKIARSKSSHNALEEFVAHLIHNATSDFALINALQQWGNQYRPHIDWLPLYTQIQDAEDRRLENAQPAILMTITRCDQASTQAQEDETFYQLNAWLIEDIETYRSQKIGYRNLLNTTDSSDAAPCLLEELLQKITHLMNCILAEQRRLCNYCQNYPQIHIFLPLELMNLGVDVWPLNPETSRRPEYLGHDHIVVIRCANRYDGNYAKSPSWLKLWKRHQRLSREYAKNTFISGHDHDLDELVSVLDAAIQPEKEDGKIVGLHVTQAPVNTEELCYEVLDSGLPLAIWTRSNLADLSHEAELLSLLEVCCLEQLPYTVKCKRFETRQKRNSPDCHIGHHLSLLWDDPYLVPPKSA